MGRGRTDDLVHGFVDPACEVLGFCRGVGALFVGFCGVVAVHGWLEGVEICRVLEDLFEECKRSNAVSMKSRGWMCAMKKQ